MASSGNFATMNPLHKTSNNVVYSNGNLTISPTSNWSTTTYCKSTMVIPKDKKIYVEMRLNSGGGVYASLGCATNLGVPSGTNVGGDGSVTLYHDAKYVNGSVTNSWITSASAGDILQLAVYGSNNKVWLGYNNTKKKYKDNMDIIHAQVDRYRKEGYPENNGLARTTVMFMRHNKDDVKQQMNTWWEEMKYGSRRDQISFNYSAWKNDFEFSYIQEDIDDNPYFLYMKKWRQIKRKEKRNSYIEYAPISLDYFLNMEMANGGGGKEIIKQDGQLKAVKDIYMFYSVPGNMKTVRSQLNPDNWQYFNCMVGEFRKNVADHHELGWDKMTEDYYNSLEMMSDEEIELFLKQNPVEFDNGFIRHSYHRACAMIGRLISGKKYIPFYMKKNQIYDNPRKHDGQHRIKPLIQNVKGISDISIPAGEFTICQSGILALMGIRSNDDIDIIISSEARNQLFNGNKEFIRTNSAEIFEPNRGKFRIFNAQGDDDLIENYSFNVGGYNFLEPRFYFSRKNKHTDRDKSDWDAMRKFFEMGSYRGYTFNQLTDEQWGVQYI